MKLKLRIICLTKDNCYVKNLNKHKIYFIQYI
ncbi:hypothetical protein [Plasmodium yoelii yoelii]|uniref:Uncharacterized protein n=1 Tax=Plasmodium yoelii yoelii TaxID=73239 RepID=Q7R8S2_PLAYO|nr:hypothetical protein [Plasmodium yoelii yoelii]